MSISRKFIRSLTKGCVVHLRSIEVKGELVDQRLLREDIREKLFKKEPNLKKHELVSVSEMIVQRAILFCRKLSDRKIKQQIYLRLKKEHPEFTSSELEAHTAVLFGLAMKPSSMVVLRAGGDLGASETRRRERMKVVKSNRFRRRQDQPLSKADQRWVRNG